MSYDSVILADSPAVYYKCQETSGTVLNDASGNGRHGTIVGGTVLNDTGLTASPVGTEKHFRLDGVDDYLDLAGATNWFAPAGVGFSLEAWMYQEDVRSYPRYFDMATTTGVLDVVLSAINLNNGLRFDTGGGNGSWTFGSPTGAWFHWVVTVTSAGSAILYKNGVSQGTITVGAPTSTNRVNKYLGRSNTGGDPYLKAGVTRVAVYHSVLSAARVLAHYNEGLTTPVVAPGAPTGLTVTQAMTSLTLAWAATATATGYRVRIDGGTATDVGDVLSYAFTGLGSGTTHTLEVQAYNSGGSSAFTAAIGTTLEGPPSPLGPHKVVVGPSTDPDATDLSCWVDEVSIVHGRQDSDSQPEASTATINLGGALGMDPLPALEIGYQIAITTFISVDEDVRFVGTISDISYGWEDVGEDTPDWPVGQLMAVGILADVGRRIVGDAPWPQELDGARVARIMTAAGVPWDGLVSDPGTVQVLARDVDAQPALGLAQEAAQSAGGVVWQTRANEVRYADAEHRRGITPKVTLDACDVLVTPTWRRTTEGLINQVSITYGEPSATYAASRADSITRYGTFGLSVSTVLAALADATAMANLLLTRNSSPVWVMGNLPIDLKGLSDTQRTLVLSLDQGDLVELLGLPAAADAPTSAYLWVEGSSERLAFGEHELELAVSGYCRTAPAPRWNDVPNSVTWDSFGATTTWDDMTCLGPVIPTGGRWDDVPASTRWDSVPPTTTWNTWS